MTIGKNTIWVGPGDAADPKPLCIEGVSLTASVLPGTVMDQVATGLQTNANAATVFGQELLVADKDSLRQKAITDTWVQNENMVAIKARSGDFLNVIVAASQNITSKGTALANNGSGNLAIAATNGTEQVLAYSDEIVDTTGGAQLVRVRVA